MVGSIIARTRATFSQGNPGSGVLDDGVDVIPNADTEELVVGYE